MFTSKMKDLPVSDEAAVFYLSNCLRDADFVEVQRQDGGDPPKIRLDFEYAKQYYSINDLAQRDMDLIIEELREVGLIDER
jgi:DNA-binding transcriptional ArsR family regulator